MELVSLAMIKMVIMRLTMAMKISKQNVNSNLIKYTKSHVYLDVLQPIANHLLKCS